MDKNQTRDLQSENIKSEIVQSENLQNEILDSEITQNGNFKSEILQIEAQDSKIAMESKTKDSKESETTESIEFYRI